MRVDWKGELVCRGVLRDETFHYTRNTVRGWGQGMIQESVCACESLAYNWGAMSDEDASRAMGSTHITVCDAGGRGESGRG